MTRSIYVQVKTRVYVGVKTRVYVGIKTRVSVKVETGIRTCSKNTSFTWQLQPHAQIQKQNLTRSI